MVPVRFLLVALTAQIVKRKAPNPNARASLSFSPRDALLGAVSARTTFCASLNTSRIEVGSTSGVHGVDLYQAVLQNGKARTFSSGEPTTENLIFTENGFKDGAGRVHVSLIHCSTYSWQRLICPQPKAIGFPKTP
uniref:Uncharacterized protein n=1 Tax=Rhodosorus marinus TaxID=101924 RepID=A0A7S0BFE3_9RHOD